jgi:transposase
MIFGLGPATKIFVAVEASDMRKGFEGLQAVGARPPGTRSLSGHLFLFTNKARGRVT